MTKSRRSIVIFGINYWPEHTGIAPYTTGLAEHLAETGWDVSVVTGLPHYPAWSVPDGHRYRARSETINGVSVNRRWHYVPSRASAFRRGLFEFSFFAHGVATSPRSAPDAILGIAPSVSGALLASTYARRTRRPYGVLFQDLSGAAAAQSGIPGGRSVADVVVRLESLAVRGASAVGIVAEGFRDHLRALGIEDSKIHRIRNWNNYHPPTEDRESTRKLFGWPTDAWVVLHAGNMGFKQGLENLIDTARLALNREDSPLFVLMGDGNQRDHLMAYCDGLPNVQFLPTQAIDSGYPNALEAADTLIVNQRSTVVEMCLPSKLCSYLGSGTPVIAAVADGSETAHELRASDAGLVVPSGSPILLLDAIERIRSSPSMSAELGKRGAEFATANLTPTAAFAAIDQFLDALLASSATKSPTTELAIAQGD